MQPLYAFRVRRDNPQVASTLLGISTLSLISFLKTTLLNSERKKCLLRRIEDNAVPNQELQNDHQEKARKLCQVARLWILQRHSY